MTLVRHRVTHLVFQHERLVGRGWRPRQRPPEVAVAERVEHLGRRLRAHTGELPLHEAGQRVRLRRLQHLDQRPQLDAVRVGADLFRLRGEFRVVHPFELARLVECGFVQRHPCVGVDDGSLFHVLTQLRPGAHVRLHLQLDPGAVGSVPRRRLLVLDLRLVRVRVDDQLEVLRRLRPLRPGGDPCRLAGGELRVEYGRGDADPLLPTVLFAGVEPRPVQQLPEHLRHLFGGDSRSVVLDDDFVVVADLGDIYVHVRLDAGLLGGVERVVHTLFHGGDQPPRPRVEAEHVLVLLEELGDRDLLLALGQLVRDSRVLAERRLERGHLLPRSSATRISSPLPEWN